MAETLISPGISMQEIDQSAIAPRPLVAGAALVGPTVKGNVLIPTKVTSYSEYVQKFGTTFETAIYSGSTGTPVQQEFMTSLAAKSFFEQGGESLLVVRVASDEAFKPAQNTTIVNPVFTSGTTGLKVSGSAAASFVLKTLGKGAVFNSCADATYSASTSGSLPSGTADNFRFEISNVNSDKGTFSVIIRKGNDDANNEVILESFANVSLDPNSNNYIAAVIGDQYQRIANDGSETYVETVGNYINKSAYVRVEVTHPTPNYLANDGTVNSGSTTFTPTEGTGSTTVETSYKNFLPKAQEGAFYNGEGIVGHVYSGSNDISADNSGTVAYFNGITKANATGITHPQATSKENYETAFELLRNTDEYQINIISAPGILGANKADLVGKLAAVADDRKDCIAVVDLNEFGADIASVETNASMVNSSYAASYWPWLQMYSATGKLVWVPASVVIPGLYMYNDHAAAPWYAPAGMTRGGVSGVLQAERKLTKNMRDKLYEKNVNPIATLPGAGLVAYGQKTLQKKASALDRVNVRRLLLEVKKRVKDMASGLLFEQNTTALQNSFKAQLDPYLASIVQRNGLYAYKISLDGNTPDAVDRNEFHCAIYLQPTKTIEFIYLSFIITATGVEFE